MRKALVRFREGLGGNLRGAPSLLDLRLVCGEACFARLRKTDHIHDHVHVGVDVDVVVHVLVVDCRVWFENFALTTISLESAAQILIAGPCRRRTTRSRNPRSRAAYSPRDFGPG